MRDSLAKDKKYATLRKKIRRKAFMDNKFSNFAPYAKTSSPKKKAFFYVAIFVVIIGVAILAGNYFLSKKSDVTPAVTPTPTTFVVPTDTPTPSESVTPTGNVTPSPTGKVTGTPTPTAKAGTPTPSSSATKQLQVEVLNGSGTPGQAGKVASLLKASGYAITSTANADTFDYPDTVIQIKKSKNQFAAQLKKDLSTDYTVNATIQTLAESATPDAIVIVGAK